MAERRSGAQLAGVIVGLVGLAVVGLSAYRMLFDGGPAFSTPRLSGDALIAGPADGPSVVVLSSHWEYTWRSGSGRGTWVRSGGILHWDVFAFDAATLERRFVTRISSIRNGGRESRESVLGASDGVIWVLADRLVGVREVGGGIVADAAALEAKEPRLKGMIPNDPKRFVFDKGLIITAADAKRWRVAGPDASITEVSGASIAPEPSQTTWLPVGDMPPNQSLKRRSTVIEGVWYGLGVVEEREKFATEGEWSQDFREPRRYKLWSGPAKTKSSVQEIPSSESFLQGGLLIQEQKGPDRLIGIANPYRLLVLHQDRIDTRAKQSLTCLGLDGTPCWSTPLQVSTIRNVAPIGTKADEFATLLFAVDYQVDEKGDFVDGGRDANDAILRVSMKDGSLRRVDFGTMDLAEVKSAAGGGSRK